MLKDLFGMVGLYTGSWRVVLLNVIAGLALVTAAAWFSYSVFSTRDAAEVNRTEIQENKAVLQEKLIEPPVVIVVPAPAPPISR